jgi:type II secretory pathway pseudopilin PulG
VLGAKALTAAALIVIVGCGRSQQATSATMRQDLAEMRTAIRDYRRDKGHPPRALNDLVASRHLRTIPKDPVTGAGDWRVVTEEPVRVDDFTGGAPPPPAGGIVDVHSIAAGTDANGKPWSEY